MRHYLVLHGRARLTEGGAPELLQQLAYTYVGPGVKFPPMPEPPPGHRHAHRGRPHRRLRPLGLLMGYYDLVKDLPLEIEDVDFDIAEFRVSERVQRGGRRS